MRAALISLASQPRDTVRDAPLALAGKTLAERQLEFAIAAGSESVIALGDGGSGEAIALRHAAEAAGARFTAIHDSHGLLGALGANDELLVLAAGLLPEAEEALHALEGESLTVLPASAGVPAGFERIDLERAWGGALVIRGTRIERLSDLPADSDPASALLRIALQAHVPQRSLPEELVAGGSWAMLRDGEELARHERRWIERHARPLAPLSPSERLAELALRPLAGRLIEAGRRSVDGLTFGILAALALSAVAAWYSLGWLGFALVALSVVLSGMAAGLVRLQRAPFSRRTRGISLLALLPGLVDAALLSCAVLTIEGTWLHRLFPPLVLLGALHALPGEALPKGQTVVTDRGLLALFLAVSASFGGLEQAIMLASLGLIVLSATYRRARRG